MNKDKFTDTLIAQYREEIEEVLLECEHVYHSTMDYDLLNKKVNEILKSAEGDGLSEKMIWDIIHAKIPSYVNFLNYKNSGKKAA